MALNKQWAAEPLDLIPTPKFLSQKTDMWTEGASSMCLVHNVIFRGYNSIYQQAPHIADADKADFIGYCLTWYKMVHTHATEEERGFFPMAEKLLGDEVFKHTHAEHEAFIPALAEFHSYLSSLRSPRDLSSSQLLQIMSRFEKPFEDHFRSEITTIANLTNHRNALREGTIEEVEARAKFERWGERTIIRGGITDIALFFLFNLDQGFEDGLWRSWPPIPGPVRWALVNVGRLVHSGWWKFASCDGSGKPKELYALGCNHTRAT